MARPAMKELTQRELEVMHVFWDQGELTAMDACQCLADAGESLAYVAVANLVRILVDKGFLESTNDVRPFRYQPVRSFEEVSGSLVRDLIQRVFHGSRERLLVRLLSEKRLTSRERAVLQDILNGKDS